MHRRQNGGIHFFLRISRKSSGDPSGVFTSVMLTKNPSDCLEMIMTFESEVRQGEHSKAKNLAAILTKRLKALP